MKTSKFSSLSKQDLIEILEKIPVNFVFYAVRDLSEKAFDKCTEAHLQELKKIEQLNKEIQKKDDSECSDFVLSELKKAEALYKKCDARYENLNKICRKIMEENYE